MPIISAGSREAARWGWVIVLGLLLPKAALNWPLTAYPSTLHTPQPHLPINWLNKNPLLPHCWTPLRVLNWFACPRVSPVGPRCPGLQGASIREPPVLLCLPLLHGCAVGMPGCLCPSPLGAPWAVLVWQTCSPTAPNQGLGRCHPQKPGQNQKYVCKKAENFIGLSFLFSREAKKSKQPSQEEKEAVPERRARRAPPRGRGAGPGSPVTELPKSLPLSCRKLQLSPLDAEDRGRGAGHIQGLRAASEVRRLAPGPVAAPVTGLVAVGLLVLVIPGKSRGKDAQAGADSPEARSGPQGEPQPLPSLVR